MFRALTFLVTAYCVLSTQYCPAQERVSVHLTMGNPSQAKPHESERGNYLLVHDEYCLSFNARTGLCNWVSWRLAGDDIGEADRANFDFTADEDLPAALKQPPMRLCAGSGFDKGHVLPFKDRSRRAKSGKLTFKGPNCLPQAPKVNRGPWNQHEEHRRKLAADGNELYIVAGPAGRGGRGEKGFAQTLGKPLPAWDSWGIESDGMDVPAWCWAACLILPERSGNDLRRVTAQTPAMAVIMPNTQDVSGSWRDYLVRIRDVEDLTGLKLFDLVDEDVQEALEAAAVETK